MTSQVRNLRCRSIVTIDMDDLRGEVKFTCTNFSENSLL